MSREEVSRFLEWVKGVSLMFDGSAYRTMLRNDAYAFSRIGVFIERADNTALILNGEMPRSLAACYDNLTRYLDQIAHAYGRQGPSQRQARLTQSRLQNMR